MKKLKPFVFLLLSSLVLWSCGTDDDGINVNLTEFEPIPEPYPYTNLVTDNAVDYLELVYSDNFESEDILFNLGVKCENSTDQNDCIAQFDAMESETGGFATGCLPDYCFHYIKYQIGDNIAMVTNTSELKTFLGDIDSKSDAILLAISKNYRFSTEEKEIGAIREMTSGYHLLMTKRVSDCSPIQTNRFHLEVTTDGTINILGEEEYSSSGGCI